MTLGLMRRRWARSLWLNSKLSRHFRSVAPASVERVISPAIFSKSASFTRVDAAFGKKRLRSRPAGSRGPDATLFRAPGLVPPMSPDAVTTQEEEAGLRAFLDTLPEDAVVPARTLAHAWAAAGGSLAPGRVSVRLLGPAQGDRPAFTAATLYAPRGEATAPTLEFAKPFLEHHGVDADRFVHWADEVVDVAGGLDPTAKFPTLRLGPDLPASDLARLVSALRDLARMAGA